MPARLDLTFRPEREEAELREYLGERFELERLQRYHEQLESEFADCGDEAAFYRTSTGYLYNLTAFAMTGTKLPYLRELVRRVPPGSRVLDYGCGIGSDGLLLAEAGYRVEFADFGNPSTRYLRWRLEHRGLQAPVHDLAEHVPGGFDAVYAFDVIEHVDDPFAFLAELERRAHLVEVNFLEPVPGETALHHDLPVAALLAHVSRHSLSGYRLLHGRSHLVLYGSGPTSAIQRLISRGRIVAERVMRRGAAEAR
ncbi:MAG: methyltransferase domain-containing protein [Actinomycetota bacterium]|nr:methyltransferase domain-containing protein [Actinomycetota bacterium]